MSSKQILTDGTRVWRDILGLRHREDGPAVEYSDGSKLWYSHGDLHREDGPALIFDTGYQEWYTYGMKVT